MVLTNEQKGEIRAAYRDAANPKKQITILAQLYATSKEEICKVLGIEAPEQKPKKTLRSYEQAVKDDVVKAVLLEGATYQEAAERFGVPYGNVNAWVNKARKRRAEFDRYAEAVEAEPLPVAAVAPTDASKPASGTAEPTSFPQRVLQEVKEGVAGLDDFVTNFAGIDIFSEDELNMLDRIQERAAGCLYGLETGIELMKEEARSNARDSQGPRTTA